MFQAFFFFKKSCVKGIDWDSGFRVVCDFPPSLFIFLQSNVIKSEKYKKNSFTLQAQIKKNTNIKIYKFVCVVEINNYKHKQKYMNKEISSLIYFFDKVEN